MTRAILHIGVEKTGTTSLQETLSYNREHLNLYGFHYSLAAGESSHWALPIYAAAPHATADLQRYLGIKDESMLSDYIIRFEVNLHREVELYRSHCFIFSNEHCHSRLDDQVSVDKL